jgi:cyanophycinase
MRYPLKRRMLDIEALETRIAMSAVASLGLESAQARGKVRLPYTYSVAGNAADFGAFPANLASQNSGLALVGGGTDVDKVFEWMGAKADGGDFLVIRATGTDGYNSYIDRLAPSLDSVATLIIPDRTAANNADVSQIILGAEAIFLAGGDQADYVNFWNNTAVETALYQAILHNIPIGGTSAGLAVLGEIDFSSAAGTITSSEALANPLDIRIVVGLDASFLSPEASELQQATVAPVLQYLDDVITDSHFMQRDRMGRLVTFMANADAQNLVPGRPRGIGVNEQTALLINANGLAQVVGNAYGNKKLSATQQQRSVYLIQGSTSNPSLASNVPLEYSVDVVRASFDPLTNVPVIFDLDDLYTSSGWELVGHDNYDVVASGGSIMPVDLTGLLYGEASVKRRSGLV